MNGTKPSKMADEELEQAVLNEIMPKDILKSCYCCTIAYTHGYIDKWNPLKIPYQCQYVLRRMWDLGWEIGQCSGQTYEAHNENSPFRHWSVWITKGRFRADSRSEENDARPLLEAALKAVRMEKKK